MEALSDRDALYSVDFSGPRPADGEFGARRWDFCGVVGWEEGAVATCGVADLAGRVDGNIEREILRNSTRIFISVVTSGEEKRESDTYLCKLSRFSAAVTLALQVGTPHGRPL